MALRCEIDNWRWAGVPFYLRTGKQMAEGARIVSIAFREPPKSMFPAGSGVGAQGPDHLTFDLADSSKLSLSFYGKRPGPGHEARQAEPAVRPARDRAAPSDVLEAYERLIHDAMSGDQTLFTNAEGIERLWEVSQPAPRPTRRRCSSTGSGSWGPSAIDDLIAPRTWRLPFERGWRQTAGDRHRDPRGLPDPAASTPWSTWGLRDGHVIVCGLRGVGLRTVEQLHRAAFRWWWSTTTPTSGWPGSSRAGASPTSTAAPTSGTGWPRPGSTGPSAVICVETNELATLEIAMRVREARPDVRLVVQLANPSVGRALERVTGTGTVLDVAALAAPSFVEVCLRPAVPRRWNWAASVFAVVEVR